MNTEGKIIPKPSCDICGQDLDGPDSGICFDCYAYEIKRGVQQINRQE